MNKPRFESYLDDGRQRYNLIIPFGSPKKYHWWNGGQSVLDTATELILTGEGLGLPCPVDWFAGGYGMSEPRIFRLHLASLHIEIRIPEKGDYATYTFHAMPNYLGVGGDRLTLAEVAQLRNFCDTVENGWPKKG
jgi:hypothetical protein